LRLDLIGGKAGLVLVKTVSCSVSSGISTFEAVAHRAAAPQREFRAIIRFRKEIQPPETLGDPFLAAFLVPTMFLGEELAIQAPVSIRLLDSLATVQIILNHWFPAILREVAVHAPHVLKAAGPEERRGTASFFSGGVDSWYSLLKHSNEISALVTVKGFDIPFRDETVFNDLAAANQRIATAVGKEFIAVETNLRDCLDPTCAPLGRRFDGDFWGYQLHGAFLASVGLCLQRQFRRVIIPSSWPYHRLQPWGTHPLLDPLWSTGWTEFIHDGCERERLEKLRMVSRSPAALQHLRVCPVYTPGRYNCGACEKCLRTMLMLGTLGALGRASAFDRPLDLKKLMPTMCVPKNLECVYRDVLAEAKVRGNDEMIHFLRVVLGDEFHLRRASLRVANQVGQFGAATLRSLGIKRHLHSVMKRWASFRGLC
jgi:hypothetical protein